MTERSVGDEKVLRDFKVSGDPKVSICIPSYGHARFLPEAIESALGQTYRNVEVIIVDDGSPDHSLQIAEEYAAKYPSQVRVYTHPGHSNRGISATVNLGFERATGIYYSGLPSDDVLYPDKIERQVEFLESRRDVGFVYSGMDVIDGEGRVIGVQPVEDISAEADPLERMVETNAVPGVTVLARRESIARIFPHDEELIYSDWEFWTRFLALSKVGFINRSLVKYRVHGANTSVGIAPARQLEHMLAALEALSLKAHEFAAERFRRLLDLHLSHLLFCAGEHERAAERLEAAASFRPALFTRPEEFADWVKERERKAFHPAPGVGDDFGLWAAAHAAPRLGQSFSGAARRRLTARLYAEAAFRNHEIAPRKSHEMVWRCLRNDPRRLADRSIRSLLVEAVVGPGLMNGARRLKRRLAGHRD